MPAGEAASDTGRSRLKIEIDPAEREGLSEVHTGIGKDEDQREAAEVLSALAAPPSRALTEDADAVDEPLGRR